MARLDRALPALVSRRAAPLVVLAAVLLTAVLVGLGGGDATTTASSTAGLPSGSQSARAAQLLTRLPASQVTPALVVVDRPGGGALARADTAAVDARLTAVRGLALVGRTAPAQPAPGGRVAVATVPLATDDSATGDRLTRDVKAVRAALQGLPTGLRAQVTGPAGFEVDLASVFDGADVTLLLVTVLVVAVLLLVTYRSPFLWLVPLVVVAVADRVAVAVVALTARHLGLTVDAAASGILSVVVFGAGTDYALLLVARYRDELRREASTRAAMATTLRTAGPAVLGSGTTVALALLTLLAAVAPSTRGLGYAGAVGVAVALLLGLTLLPALLVLLGRRVFWPFVPRPGQPHDDERGVWARVGRAVERRPAPVALAGVAVLAALAAGLLGARTGLSQTEQFRATPESVVAQQVLAQALPAGASEPATVVVRPGTEQAVAAAARGVPGVASADVGAAGAGIATVDVVLRDPPATAGSFAAVDALRARLSGVPGADAAVGGQVAEALDTRRGDARDRRVVVPLVLAVVLLVLLLLLRSVVAPLLLVVTVVATFFASLGAGWLVFRGVYGFPALDSGVPLLAFLFLVALGVDYNVFLATRAREEAPRLGTRDGVQRALAATGGVITSAGVLLAAVFAVLGVLPLITLTQIGVVVGLGVLLDTLLVRTVLVPALAFLLGDRFWWPWRPTADREPPAPGRAGPAPLLPSARSRERV